MVYLKFLKSLLLHKWYVFRAGLMVGVPVWRLIMHDWQKFHPLEYGRYARNYHGDYSKSPNDREQVSLEYIYAWLHHENTAPHHWGYWIPRTGNHAGEPLEMPETYIREMIADCLGAGRTYTGSWDMAGWLNENGPKWRLHNNTERKFWVIMHEIGYVITDNCDWTWMAGSKFRSWAGISNSQSI